MAPYTNTNDWKETYARYGSKRLFAYHPPKRVVIGTTFGIVIAIEYIFGTTILPSEPAIEQAAVITMEPSTVIVEMEEESLIRKPKTSQVFTQETTQSDNSSKEVEQVLKKIVRFEEDNIELPSSSMQQNPATNMLEYEKMLGPNLSKEKFEEQLEYLKEHVICNHRDFEVYLNRMNTDTYGLTATLNRLDAEKITYQNIDNQNLILIRAKKEASILYEQTFFNCRI